MSGKDFPKHQVNWNTVCGAIQDLRWRYIWLADNPVKVLNEHLYLLVRRYEQTKVTRVHKKDEPRLDEQCRHALSAFRRLFFRGPVAALWLTGKNLSMVK